MKAVITENLSKIYEGSKKAVDGVSLSIEKGQIFGFLGSNGAGKTTTVKMLCGMLVPTTGQCCVMDMDPTTEAAKLHQRIGVLTEHAQMYDHLTGIENLIVYGELFGINRTDGGKRAQELLQKLELSDAGSKKLGTYSTGMRQRLSLARALMHDPEVLFLDEPTSGLDPESAQNVNTLITELARNGKTMFLCTHQLRYAQEICTSYGLISHGRLLASGDLEELRALVSSKTMIKIKADRIPDNIEYERMKDGSFTVPVDSEKDIPEVVRKIVNSGSSVYHISSDKMSLEEIYFSLMDKEVVV